MYVSPALLAQARGLADVIADLWVTDDLAAFLRELAAKGAPNCAEVQRLARGLAPIREALHGGGWYPVAGCTLTFQDLHALYAADILTVQPWIKAGSYCIKFTSNRRLRGLPARGI